MHITKTFYCTTEISEALYINYTFFFFNGYTFGIKFLVQELNSSAAQQSQIL